jgi:hypothetical protein
VHAQLSYMLHPATSCHPNRRDTQASYFVLPLLPLHAHSQSHNTMRARETVGNLSSRWLPLCRGKRRRLIKSCLLQAPNSQSMPEASDVPHRQSHRLRPCPRRPLISFPSPRPRFSKFQPRAGLQIDLVPEPSLASPCANHLLCTLNTTRKPRVAVTYPATSEIRVFASPSRADAGALPLSSPSPSSCSARCFSSAEVMQCVFAPVLQQAVSPSFAHPPRR